MLLHRRFDEQARRTPDRIALTSGDQSITYAALADRIDRIASAMRERDVGKENLIGVHIERSIDWVVAALGVLKSGAAVLPLPPSYPAGRITSIVEIARMDAVIDSASYPLPSAFAVPRLHLDDFIAAPAQPDDQNPVSPDQAAFVLCSSGSTGEPKLIVRSHRSFFHRLEWTWSTHPYGPDELCCQKSHMTTTHSIYELFEPLLAGTSVDIVPDSIARDLEAFWTRLREKGISRLLIVPSALRASLDVIAPVVEQMNTVVLMGESVDRDLVDRMLATFPQRTHVYSIYGSTEASSTLVCDLRRRWPAGQDLPLGRPIQEDILAHVLTEDGELAAIGETGRLCIGGPTLFSGYLHDEVLTRQAFFPSKELNGPLYDTKDDVRLLDGGDIEFVGRVDHTVKIRGFRVNTEEIENVLRAQPDIDDAVVTVNRRAGADASLAAHVRPARVTRDRVQAALENILPDYMIPSIVHAVDTFPRTPSGKTDRRALIDRSRAEVSAAARTDGLSDVESVVHQEWCQALGHGDFRPDDNFFEVGGTSLGAFALTLALRERFGLEPEDFGGQLIYALPTLREQAEYVEGIGRGAAGIARVPLLVSLRAGSDLTAEPLFLVSSAGGTLGAYEKLVRRLATRREIIGIRDPFLWDRRDPTAGFQAWVRDYVTAIRERQPNGPYHIAAYSSAGAFGFEIAQQLIAAGEDVARLVLLDPLGIDSRYRWRFGHWANRSTYMRPALKRLVRVAGHVRRPFVRIWHALRPRIVNDQRWTREEFEVLAAAVKEDRQQVLTLAALLELNTGLGFELTEADLDNVRPADYLSLLASKAESLAPGFDRDSLEHILVQYQLQARAQHVYRLQPIRCPVLLVEPKTAYAGILAAQLRPYVARMHHIEIEIGEWDSRLRRLARHFASLGDHYRSMRDDVFVNALAERLKDVID